MSSEENHSSLFGHRVNANAKHLNGINGGSNLGASAASLPSTQVSGLIKTAPGFDPNAGLHHTGRTIPR